MAASLETASLRGQGRTADVIATLEALAGPDGGDGPIDAQAMASLVRSYVEAGDLDAAERHLDGVLAQDPASLGARLMRAGLDQLRGDPAAAETRYRAVISDAPALPQAHQALYALLAGQGRVDEAKVALDAGLKAAPDSSALLFTKAGFLESTGDIDGAIAAYETLYARDSASAADRQQPRQPDHQLPRRRREPRARLCHRPPAARLGRAVFPGHLRLDPAPPRRRTNRR